MNRETIAVLYKVLFNMTSVRKMLDDFMYNRAEPMDTNSEDYKHLRAVYDRICKVCDLL